MRKYLLLFICIFLIINLISCNINANTVQTEPQDSNDKTCVSDNTTEQSTSAILMYDMYEQYIPFDECFASANDVVKGKCVDIVYHDVYVEYEFKVTERYMGEDTGENIFVFSYRGVDIETLSGEEVICTYSTDNIQYKTGKEYYLILSRDKSVYNEHDIYMPVISSIYIPAEDIGKSTYCGTPLTEHSAVKSLSTEEELVAHITSCINSLDPDDIKAYDGRPYITDTDMKSIIEKSDHVLRVKVEKVSFSTSLAINTEIYECSVVSTLKGNSENYSNIEIRFFTDSVEVGGEYIVALTQVGTTEEKFFHLSSKNSLFSVDDLDEIQECLEN